MELTQLHAGTAHPRYEPFLIFFLIYAELVLSFGLSWI